MTSNHHHPRRLFPALSGRTTTEREFLWSGVHIAVLLGLGTDHAGGDSSITLDPILISFSLGQELQRGGHTSSPCMGLTQRRRLARDGEERVCRGDRLGEAVLCRRQRMS